MKIHEGEGEKFLPVTHMGDGTGHRWRTTFLMIFGQPSLLLSPQFTITEGTTFLTFLGQPPVIKKLVMKN